MIEASAPTALARRSLLGIFRRITNDPAVPINERWEFERPRMILTSTLWGAVAVEVIALASIPFVQAGPPANDWQVLLLLVTSGFTLWIFGLIAWILQGLIREAVNIDAAAKAADAEASSNRQDDQK